MEDKTKQLMDVFMSEAYKPMKLKELAILLDIPKEKREEFADILQGMIRDGRINVANHGKYPNIGEQGSWFSPWGADAL